MVLRARACACGAPQLQRRGRLSARARCGHCPPTQHGVPYAIGDVALLQSEDTGQPYVAALRGIEGDTRGNFMIKCQCAWAGGRRASGALARGGCGTR